MRTEVFPRITNNPDVCFGKPTVRGMRIRVTDVLDMLADGATRAEILASFQYLEDEDISACLAYDAEPRHRREVLPLSRGREKGARGTDSSLTT